MEVKFLWAINRISLSSSFLSRHFAVGGFGGKKAELIASLCGLEIYRIFYLVHMLYIIYKSTFFVVRIETPKKLFLESCSKKKRPPSGRLFFRGIPNFFILNTSAIIASAWLADLGGVLEPLSQKVAQPKTNLTDARTTNFRRISQKKTECLDIYLLFFVVFTYVRTCG